MRRMSENNSHPHKRSLQRGFTFVELVIIAPIVILSIGAFVAVVVNMTGEVLSSRAANVLSYNVQDALNRIEQDVKLSTTFLSTNSPNIIDSDTNQGYDDGTTVFNNAEPTANPKGQMLILNALATTGNPISSSSQVAYLANSPNPCGTQQAKNNPLTYNIVYFIKDSTLWRRTVMPATYDTTACNALGSGSPGIAAPWQRPSCTPSDTGTYPTTHCKTYDERLVSGVEPNAFTVSYFTAGNSTAASANATGSSSATTRQSALSSATTALISINAKQTVATRTIEQSASIRVTRLDTNASTLPTAVTVTAPSVPVVSASSSDPGTATFSWPASTGNGTMTYTAQYQLDNTGIWATALNNSTLRTFTFSPGHGHIVAFRVSATNGAGTSSNGSATITTPLWNNLVLKNSWTDYESSYAPAGFTKTDAGVVVLKGLIKRGAAIGANTLIGVLPPGYRPEATLIFGNTSDSNAAGRVDVLANGEIWYMAGGYAWFSLDTIRFVPNDPSITRTAYTYANSWSNYGGSYATGSSVTTAGRVYSQGLIKPGTYADYASVRNITAADAPSKWLLLPAYACSGWSWWNISSGPTSSYPGYSTAFLMRNVNPGGCMSLNASWYPSSYSGWTPLSLVNGWVAYNSGLDYIAPRWTKGSDGLCVVNGMVSGGSVTYDTTIATLPAACRPKERLIFTGVSNSAHVRIDVLANGEIHFMGTSNAWYSIDSISFMPG